MHLNEGNAMGTVPVHVKVGNETKYIPFDIENRTNNLSHLSDINVDRFASEEIHETVTNTQNSISAATVLKALFFIFVWYAFSTCLTLYNKILLGDQLWKFPAPLLMSTVHFAMQAVLSKAITCCYAQRFKPSIKIPWRDYFIRDGLCLSQLYQRPLELHWI
uniref:Uncharacterized protein n=1 Tax=Nelumbo nucifera TaxID=4432 RepID=A0A823A265_NELNU|nr:TPA_asm: hypothetical protein HUJ06_018145 [Nelumbo nucifera]